MRAIHIAVILRIRLFDFVYTAIEFFVIISILLRKFKEHEKGETIMRKIELRGLQNEVYKKIASIGLNNSCDAEQIVTFLEHNKELLCSDEKIETSIEIPDSSPGMLSLIIMRKNLYINLKVSTILIVALLLDIHMTKGFAQLLIAMMGISSRAIVAFSEENGEKCIIKETLKTQDKIGHPGILSKFRGECCNNNLNCKYRTEGMCCCTQDKIKEIFDDLVSCNMFKKVGDFYKYQW